MLKKLGSKNVYVQKNFGPKKYASKNVGSTKFWSTTFLVQRNFKVQKNLGQTKFWWKNPYQKKLRLTKNWFPKVWSKLGQQQLNYSIYGQKWHQEKCCFDKFYCDSWHLLKTVLDGRRSPMEDNLWWKTTFDGRWPLMEDDLWWKTNFDGRWPSMKDNLLWETTFDEIQP